MKPVLIIAGAVGLLVLLQRKSSTAPLPRAIATSSQTPNALKSPVSLLSAYAPGDSTVNTALTATGLALKVAGQVATQVGASAAASAIGSAASSFTAVTLPYTIGSTISALAGWTTPQYKTFIEYANAQASGYRSMADSYQTKQPRYRVPFTSQSLITLAKTGTRDIQADLQSHIQDALTKAAFWQKFVDVYNQGGGGTQGYIALANSSLGNQADALWKLYLSGYSGF